VEVTDPDKGLLNPEMTGTVAIVEDHRADVLHIPAGAVTREAGKAYVTTPTGQKREVTLGLLGSDVVEVTKGLAEGDAVVVGAEELPTRWKSDNRGPP
jgi:multidrug efflux pump subunit AcrA (membrane-fusion protein)